MTRTAKNKAIVISLQDILRLLKKSPCVVAVHPVNPHVCLIRCGCPSSGALQDELFQQPTILMTLSSIWGYPYRISLCARCAEIFLAVSITMSLIISMYSIVIRVVGPDTLIPATYFPV